MIQKGKKKKTVQADQPYSTGNDHSEVNMASL